ncbi:U-box domain-containing protein 6 [Apostasia shenzhenica]|uniref:RING-type E3 ubiquitin transferase n=1 Tax=Apostasia shenzhenica TaxID=1088818 RepID=A0A2I0BEA5_9ASPA|nr:U-box domain-containing protein 6 [Apostasia shenzhenica]
MDASDAEENLFAVGDAKLHGGMCRELSAIVYKILAIFPVLEEARPRSKSGIQALCSLHVALDKSKNLLQHCSDCSKLYLAITGDSILMKFEKARCSLQESLTKVQEIVPQAVGCQVMEIVGELERNVFVLDQVEKKVGDDVISLLHKEKIYSDTNDAIELEVFHRAALKLRITSSRAALTERRALKKLIEKSRAEEDKRKESIVAYLLHLMRKYSKLFRIDMPDDSHSQGSNPNSPTILESFEGRQLSKLGSFNFKPSFLPSGETPTPPEELRCPISLQLMYDPVIIASGQTYESVCIEKWFKDGHNTCPKTQQHLPHLSLTPNFCVKGLIASWCEQNGFPLPDAPPSPLDLNYLRLSLFEQDVVDSNSVGSINSGQGKGVEVIPLEKSGCITDEPILNELCTGNDSCNKESGGDELENFDKLLAMLHDCKSKEKQSKAVQKIRLLLKDDEETRIYMGANGFLEALIQFLKSAIDEEDEKAQEVGALALFNLAVNNNRNKEKILSAGVIPLLEKMITNPTTCEPATAVYLNLSCIDQAKPIISSSKALPLIVQLLLPSSPNSISCKHDALLCLFNLCNHPPSISRLLQSSAIEALHSLLSSPSSTWCEKALAVLTNLALNPTGKNNITTTPGVVSSIAAALDMGPSSVQDQAVSCLLNLCDGNEKCCQLALQEGVIPGLVSMSAYGSTKGKEKARKLLKLFRDQRHREPSPIRFHADEDMVVNVVNGRDAMEELPRPLSKSRSTRIIRSLSSFWKQKHRLQPSIYNILELHSLLDRVVHVFQT